MSAFPACGRPYTLKTRWQKFCCTRCTTEAWLLQRFVPREEVSKKLEDLRKKIEAFEEELNHQMGRKIKNRIIINPAFALWKLNINYETYKSLLGSMFDNLKLRVEGEDKASKLAGGWLVPYSLACELRNFFTAMRKVSQRFFVRVAACPLCTMAFRVSKSSCSVPMIFFFC